jgi:hypothetical protein
MLVWKLYTTAVILVCSYTQTAVILGFQLYIDSCYVRVVAIHNSCYFDVVAIHKHLLYLYVSCTLTAIILL